MKKTWKRLCTGFLALATVVTALPTTPVHAESKQYWTESAERVGIIEKVMNDGSIGSTFNEGYMKVEGETAYCIDINTDFKNGYKTRADASSRMSADQISDVALSLEYVKQYGEAHKELNYKQVYLLEQCVVWQRLSVHLGWQCDNVRASYDEIPKATQDEVFSGAKAFVKENKGRYECGGYIYSGEGQELGQFWAKLNVGNTKLQKVSSNTSITDGNGNYSIAGATYKHFSNHSGKGVRLMKPSDFQKTVQCRFESCLKKVVRHIVKDYQQGLKRRKDKEIPFCELPEIFVENFAVWDDYETDYTIFSVCGIDIRVLDDELAEALKKLPERKRNTLLMYYFLEMTESEIANLQKITQSGVFRNRHHALETMKKILKEKQ